MTYGGPHEGLVLIDDLRLEVHDLYKIYDELNWSKLIDILAK
jgi:hypothetical protein